MTITSISSKEQLLPSTQHFPLQLTDLSEDLLFKILSKLNCFGKNFRCINKKFDRAFCQNIRVAEQAFQTSGNDVCKILKNMTGLTSLILRTGEYTNIEELNETNLSLQKVAFHFSENHQVDLDSKLEKIFEYLPNLRAIDLSHNIGFQGSLFNDSAPLISRLTTLKLDSCKAICPSNFLTLLKCAKQLQSLSLVSFFHHDQMLEHLGSEPLNQLTKLKLGDDRMDDRTLTAFLSGTAKLRNLYIWNAQLIGNAFSDSGCHFEHLTKLMLERIETLTYQNIECLIRKAPLLSILHLEECGGDEDLKFTNPTFHHTNLQCLEINYNILLKESVVEQFAALSPNLAKVCLRNSCELTTDAIDCLIRSCPKVEHLDLAGCTQISESFLTNISRKLPSLRELFLDGIKLTSQGMDQIASVVNLIELDVDYTDLSAADLHSKLLNLKNLQRVKLPSNITDEILYTIADSMPRLESVELGTDFEPSYTKGGMSRAIQHRQSKSGILRILEV